MLVICIIIGATAGVALGNMLPHPSVEGRAEGASAQTHDATGVHGLWRRNDDSTDVVARQHQQLEEVRILRGEHLGSAPAQRVACNEKVTTISLPMDRVRSCS